MFLTSLMPHSLQYSSQKRLKWVGLGYFLEPKFGIFQPSRFNTFRCVSLVVLSQDEGYKGSDLIYSFLFITLQTSYSSRIEH